jgi:capsule polysaccharide export protein KpsE/RkpR
MSGVGAKQSPVPNEPEVFVPEVLDDRDFAAARERQARAMRLVWDRRRTVLKAGGIALLATTLIAFLIPRSYTSTAQLMPPDSQSSTGMAMLAALGASKAGPGLATMAGDLLGLKSSGAMFIGILRSETAQDRLVQQFDLRKVYGIRLLVDARKKLDERTSVSEDRKSGIITISVSDHNAQRAAALANAYVDQLNVLVAQLSTSAAHRERVFLEERLKVAKIELDDAVNALAQFSSKNNTIDIQNEGKAMLEAAGTLAGELIAAQSQLEGLRQIYTDNNSRVRALNGRVAELRKQLEKLGGIPANDANASGPSAPQPADQSAAKASSLPFPTIHNLPLLGAKYADYYRRAKIQETVFELLTEQYELAKVQEAKETPSVKVLDPGQVPEKKSFPPRVLIIFLGTFLAVSGSVVWVLGTRSWEQTDPNDPRKLLAQEVVATLRTSGPWALRNGSDASANGHGFWGRFSGRRSPDGTADDK